MPRSSALETWGEHSPLVSRHSFLAPPSSGCQGNHWKEFTSSIERTPARWPPLGLGWREGKPGITPQLLVFPSICWADRWKHQPWRAQIHNNQDLPRRRSLCRKSLLLPPFDPPFQKVDLLEIQVLHLIRRFRTTDAATAINKVRFGLVHTRDQNLELG